MSSAVYTRGLPVQVLRCRSPSMLYADFTLNDYFKLRLQTRFSQLEENPWSLNLAWIWTHPLVSVIRCGGSQRHSSWQYNKTPDSRKWIILSVWHQAHTGMLINLIQLSRATPETCRAAAPEDQDWEILKRRETFRMEMIQKLCCYCKVSTIIGPACSHDWAWELITWNNWNNWFQFDRIIGHDPKLCRNFLNELYNSFF